MEVTSSMLTASNAPSRVTGEKLFPMVTLAPEPNDPHWDVPLGLALGIQDNVPGSIPPQGQIG